MKKILTLLTMSLLGCSLSLAQVNTNNEDGVVKLEPYARMQSRPGEVIVKFRSDGSVRSMSRGSYRTTGVTAVDNILHDIGATEVEPLMPLTGELQTDAQTGAKARSIKTYTGQEVELKDMSKLYAIKYDMSLFANVQDVIAKLMESSEVEYAEPNYIVYAMSAGDAETYSKEPMYSQQWGLERVGLPKLWDKPRIRDRRSVIAILDTGVDTTHPDLAANIWTNEDEADTGIDDDNNGYIDDLHGWDFVNNSPTVRDNNGHGTHCAGIAAAVGNNGIGITGANPDALVMPITVLQSNGQGDVATIIKGIDYAVANGADIISMSFGNYTYSVAQEQALAKAYHKAVLVAAAGNDGICLGPVGAHPHKLPHYPCFPAAFQFVIGVQASDHNVAQASFSNYDFDGPIFSDYDEEKLYNYEIAAPGFLILSTYPGGQYKELNGTSMSCPLVAGAVSVLLEKKEYGSKESLLGDLIHTSAREKDDQVGVLNVFDAYMISDDDRRPNLSVVSLEMNDTEGDNDGYYDAGELIAIYPVLRNDWGLATDIKLSIEVAEDEDPKIVELVETNVDFGYKLSGYAKAKSRNPLKFRISETCADNQRIGMTIKAACNNVTIAEKQIVLSVENAEILRGIISENTTLYPGKKYVISGKLAIPEGVSLTLKPGVTIERRDGSSISNHGMIKAIGTPDSMIIMDGLIGIGDYDYVRFNNQDKFGYSGYAFEGSITNCIMNTCLSTPYNRNIRYCNIINGQILHYEYIHGEYNNYANNALDLEKTNMFGRKNNVVSNYLYPYYLYEDWAYLSGNICSYWYSTNNVDVLELDESYWGTDNDDILKSTIFDTNNRYFRVGFGTVDYRNRVSRPYKEAHGIVWKVLVDGKDAQDEFNEMNPVGVGRHQFDIYFNRPMDTSVAPVISMGARKPYTQTIIDQDGEWSADSTIYTVYLDATVKNTTNGLNSIYVREAKDTDHFEIPEESHRFRVMVQTAGSMSSGFEAEAGLGKVSLKWDEVKELSPDFLGLNIYRFESDESNPSNVINSDTLLVNKSPLEKTATEYVDYDIIPNHTYYYYVAEMTTSMVNNVLTNTVGVTPLTSCSGDANGSGNVDVADIVSDIAFITHQDPRPFIFEAADVNADSNIDIFDIVGTINIIATPASAYAIGKTSVLYYHQNGKLYLHNEVPVSGLQFTLSSDNVDDARIAESLVGFEVVSFDDMDNHKTWIVYSLNGKSLLPGEHEILTVDDVAVVSDIRVSDVTGNKLNVEFRSPTGVIPVITPENSVNLRVVVLNQNGSTIATGLTEFKRLEDWILAQKLQRGVYFVCLYSKTGKLEGVKKVYIND